MHSRFHWHGKTPGAMLFVADKARSLGIGSTLLEWAKSQSSQISLDVNEQNPRAAVFYIKRGFTVVGRSEVDARGCPFPLLHMSWKAVRENAPRCLPRPCSRPWTGRWASCRAVVADLLEK